MHYIAKAIMTSHRAPGPAPLAASEPSSQDMDGERVRLLALQAEVGLALAANDALAAGLGACVDALVRQVNAAFARIWVLDESEPVLVLAASAGMYTHLDGAHGRVPVGQFKIGLIAAERAPHLTNHVVGDPRVGDQAWATREGMVSFAGYPLIVGTKLVGVVALFARHELSDATLRTLAAVSTSIAQVIERARAQDRLQASEKRSEIERARLHHFLMVAPALICVLRGPDHVFELANPLSTALLGGRSVLGKPFREAMPELEGQGFYELLDGVFTSGQAYVGTEVPAAIDRDGTGRPQQGFFNFVYQPMRDVAGAVEGILVHAVEVTEHVLARRALEQSIIEARKLHEELLQAEHVHRQLVDNVPELAWSARPDGHTDFYNRRWYEYTGTTFEQMQGWGWKDVHDPELIDEVTTRWQRSLDRGEPFEMEYRLRGADGELRWFLTRARPLRDRNGTIVRWFGTNTDIHEQREAKRRTEALLAEVTDQAREMTEAVRQMRDARDEAERRLAEHERRAKAGA